MTLKLNLLGKKSEYKIKRNSFTLIKNKKTNCFQVLVFFMPIVIISVLTVGIVTPFYKYKRDLNVKAIETYENFGVDFTEPKKLLTIVNSENALPQSYDLNLCTFEGVQIDRAILNDLKKMLSDAKEQNVNLKVIEGYISFDEQKKIYDSEINKVSASEGISRIKAKKQVEEYISLPGKDDHQTGLSVNIVDEAESPDFTLTKESAWLQRNSVNYGFIIRYPSGKKSITKKEYNPHFFRYVGTDAAQKMRIMNMCLEEYVSYLSER